MQYKFFTIPALGGDDPTLAEEMNGFIRGHRVLNVQRELVNCGAASCWCCCVEYIDSSVSPIPGRFKPKEKIDYRTVLSEEDFAKFRRLRECRKLLAEEEAVPPFAVFLDEQLVEVVKLPEITPATLRSVPGIGEKKVEKYGKRFVELWKNSQNETSRQSVSSDS